MPSLPPQASNTTDKDDDGATAADPPPPAHHLHVIFVHLDWGIGGAEQLMLQLARASRAAGHTVELRTTHCDPHHCFAALKPPSTDSTTRDTKDDDDRSSLFPFLKVSGGWIPTHLLFHKGQALCSTLRLLYLAYQTARSVSQDNKGNTLIVLDVLPTPLWILRYCTDCSLLFYCHFPDRLLVRQPQNNEPPRSMSLRRGYRRVMDGLEEVSMRLADTVVVNSQFTRRTVLQTFPSLRQPSDNDSPTPKLQLPVLYPALDDVDRSSNGGGNDDDNNQKNPHLIVSLNRFERKKNLGLLLEAVAWIQEQASSNNRKPSNIQLVIAGGYDPRNVENVEYRGELGTLARKLRLLNNNDNSNIQVDFRLSVSDTERQHLLRTAAAVVYTPANEHFGIVPLEAMDAGTVVIAVNSGGPVETVLDGVTGYLCEPTAAAFGAAIQRVLRDPAQAVAMGRAGQKHARAKFGFARLCREWRDLTAATVQEGRRRCRSAQSRYYRVVHPRTVLYLLEAAVALLVVGMLTWLLRATGVLEPRQSILGGVRTVWMDRRDEL